VVGLKEYSSCILQY